MRRPIDTTIDPDLCTGCEACVGVCPTEAIAMADGKAVVVGDESIGCGHCAAACPTGAIAVASIDDGALALATVAGAGRYIPPGGFDAGALVSLMRSRRSCRNYRGEPVRREVLEDLVRIGTAAPSGSNSQRWTFTILPDREAVLRLAQGVAEFFRRLNRNAERAWLRVLSRILWKDALGRYYREYHGTVERALREWDEQRRDRLFHGATAAILVGSRPGGSCPAEDALLASQNILLAAHAMGLGSCLIGFAVEAIRRDARLGGLLGLGQGEAVHAVVALGHPAESYERPAGRRGVEPRYPPRGGGGV